MCKSQSEGGQRCAAHTRPAYENTSILDPKWDEAAAAYASTPEGKARLTEQAQTCAAQGDYDTEARLKSALVRGADIRDANTDAAAAISHADLTTWTPVNIDEELARLYYEQAVLRARRDSQYQHVASEIARRIFDRNYYRATASRAEVTDTIEDLRATPKEERNFRHNDILAHYARVEEMDAALDHLDQQTRPLNKEFDRRGGWTRAFLVVNAGTGHVHSSMGCSTCRPTTQYHWVTEMSDKSETDIVEAAGERACTTCYPSAPVETRNRPTTLFTPEERSQQEARVQRATAAQEREAKKIANALTPDGSEYRVECTRHGYPQRERFKTERAATTWMVSNIAYYRAWAGGQDMDASMSDAHEGIIAAIAEKHGKPVDEVRTDIDKKVAAKIKRDSR